VKTTFRISAGLLILCTVMLALPGSSIRAQSGAAAVVDSSYFGTWRLVVERSTLHGAPPPREAVCIIGDRHYGLISTVMHTVDLDGIVRDFAFVSRVDGRPYAISSPNVGPGVTIVERLLDPVTIEFVVTGREGLVAEGTRTIHGGHEMTIETRVPDGYGREMTSTTVWERQSGFSSLNR
jgi:hypothetical protein